MMKTIKQTPLPLPRCQWPGDDPLMIDYHDTEWGVPVRDDRLLLEHLILDGMQAGLSWRTILHKRESFRAAFDHFDPEKIARYGNKKINELLANKNIIRNRMKIESIITNSKAWLEFQESGDGFGKFLWQFVDGKTIENHFHLDQSCPGQTEQSQAMSKALKKLGFKFVGPTICYAFMQATGMVNDHAVECFRHKPLAAASKCS